MEELEKYSKDVKTGLHRFLDDEAVYLECVQQFQEDYNFSVLGQVIQEKDYRKAFEVSHNLKGAAGNLGLMPLYRVLSGLVTKLREKKYEDLDTQYNLVVQEQKKLKEYI